MSATLEEFLPEEYRSKRAQEEKKPEEPKKYLRSPFARKREISTERQHLIDIGRLRF